MREATGKEIIILLKDSFLQMIADAPEKQEDK